MALTEKQLRKAETPSRVPAPMTKEAITRQIPRSVSIGLVLAWATGFPLALMLEPAPADVGAVPWWAFFIEVGLLTSIAMALVGLARGMRSGAGASFVASSIFTAGVFACPASGHHAIGLWWFGEFAIALTLVALSARAYLRSSA